MKTPKGTFVAAALALALLCASGPARAQSAAGDGLGWELVSTDLDVVVEPGDGRARISGTALLRAPAGSSRGPDLAIAPGEMVFDAVEATGAERITFNAAKDAASVRFAKPLRAGAEVTVRFRYRNLRPVFGRSFAVGAEGALASYSGAWYPVPAAREGASPDRLAAGTTRLTVPAAWRTLSNGRLTSSETSGAVRTETWRARREVARSFIAAPYTVTTHRVGDHDVAVYLLERHAAASRRYAEAIPPLVSILESVFGLYPFETFAVAAVPAALAPAGFGGRSEQGYFLAHEHAFDGEEVDVPLFAHELAHMWFPNLVDSVPPGDDMIDEAVAEYAVSLALERTKGERAAVDYMRFGNPSFSARGYFHLWRNGQDERLMDDYPALAGRSKGPWVYRMLRARVGDERFFHTLRSIVRDYANKTLSLTELREEFVRAAPAEARLERFFADWLDRTGAPVIDVAWEDASDASGSRVRVRLRQRTEPYDLPLDIAVDGAQGTLVHRVELSDIERSVTLESPGKPTGVRLDPDHRLLLWEPAFGPVPGVTAEWTDAEWRAWLDAEVRWLMSAYGVPGSAVAVVDGGEVRLLEGYGVARAGSERRVDAETLFQVGEVSQPVAALAALSLAREGAIDLDEDVNVRLRTWKVPESEAARTERVTVRRLLAHTSGLGPLRLEGYAPGAAVPDLARLVADGAPGVEAVPGSAYRRTRADYAILELLLSDVTGRPFDELARERVLAPLGMRLSAFAQPLPDALRQWAAAGHTTATSPIPGDWRVYPARAAEGLWASAADLAKLLVALTGTERAEVVREMARSSVEVRGDSFGPARAGLGVLVGGSTERPRLHVVGLAEGYTALLVAFPGQGKGCVVLANNGRRGLNFAVDLAQRIGSRHAWPSVPRWGG